MPNAKEKQGTINRKGYGLKSQVAQTLASEYRSGLIQHLREHGFELQVGDLRILLAKEFGFCYGVDRAVDYAYETHYKFPDRTIYLITEIIHNPRVNQKLHEMGIRFLSGHDKTYRFEDITKDDVVILPAFGVSIADMDKLHEIGCELVDTTCGSVMNVWKRVERNAKDGFTSIIHGKYSHEETIATSSRAIQLEGGRYLVVRNEEEADIVCNYIRRGGDKAEFLKRFDKAASQDFDPDRDLKRTGLANQTTMLSRESMRISDRFRQAMIERYGEDDLDSHFRSFETICSATQQRQDAVIELGNKNPDLLIVVGGYNSSNTSNLCEIAMQFAPSYHICEADCILSDKEIKHKSLETNQEILTRGWFPDGPLVVGITSGASTPDKVVEESIVRVLKCRDLDISSCLNPDLIPPGN